MSQGETPERTELGSAEDLRFERLLEDLHSTCTTLALSLKALSRKPDNAVYRASAEQQARLGRGQVRELLGFDLVVHSDEAATAAVEGVEAFFELAGKLGSEEANEQVRELFGGLVGELFAEERLADHDRPCEPLCALLAAWVELPEAAPREEAPAAAPPEPPAPRVLFEQSFSNREPAAPKPWLGAMLLAVFEHVRGLAPAEAAAQLHAQALIGFDQSIQRSLGDYRGTVTFRIVQEGECAPRIELRRSVGLSVSEG